MTDLSGRERQVADLVARGSTNKAIAEELFLSVKTVERHLSRIFDKLGLHSRAALAAMVGREDGHPARTDRT
ncbi:helix-turn-helix transcriptional regulator [Micromonospora sp. BRA006-A]|nr:helix-turn-helix transcriptional regulator [Micromonospora sp. BRA006-A]